MFTGTNWIVTLLGKRSFICRSSPGGSIIFPCPDLFLGLSVLCSYWMFIVHILGDTAEICELHSTEDVFLTPKDGIL